MQAPDSTRNIILLGMKHSGKTTLGRRLASHLGARFADLDVITERLFDPKRQTSCRDIYRLKGEPYFSRLEAEAATALCEEMAKERMVAALGGGTIENGAAMDALKDSGINVYLKDDPGVLYERIMQGGLPAFLRPEDPRDSFNSLYAHRTALFELQADIVVDIDGVGLEEAFQRLLSRVTSHDWR